MKKILSLLLGLLLVVPFGANAETTEAETFNVGDNVAVAIRKDDEKTAFHVLKASAANEQYVWLIYDGVTEHTPSLYDEPSESHEVTSNLTTASIYSNLIKGTEGWRAEEKRLLTLDDLKELGITKNASGVYEIPAKYSWLASIELTTDQETAKLLEPLKSNWYNYWLSTEDTDKTKPTGHEADIYMFYVKKNEDRTDANGVWGTLDSVNINVETEEDATEIGQNVNDLKKAIRPVVKVDKKYIVCNNTTPSTVKTGVEDYLVPLGAILLIAACGIVLTKRKSLFQKI